MSILPSRLYGRPEYHVLHIDLHLVDRRFYRDSLCSLDLSEETSVLVLTFYLYFEEVIMNSQYQITC